MIQYTDSVGMLSCHFIGVTLTALFYGITFGQAWFYFRTFRNDAFVMRLLVGLLWILDTMQLILVVRSLYIYTILWRGNSDALVYVTKEFEASMAVTSIVAFIVQLIYAYRIWRLSFNDLWITLAIIILALLALASGVGMVIKTVHDPRWDATSVSNTPASLILASTVACDSLIAGSQVYLFHRNNCAHGRLRGLISKLTVLVVNVGLLTSIDVAVFLVFFLACPLNGMFIVPYLLLSNFYLNSFLSVLNSRQLLRTIMENDNGYVHTSIFDIGLDISLPLCTMNSSTCHHHHHEQHQYYHTASPVLPVVQVGGGTFSLTGMDVTSQMGD